MLKPGATEARRAPRRSTVAERWAPPLLLALALVACATSVDDKRASFAPHEGRRIGAVPIRAFIESHRVRLFGGADEVTARVRDGHLWLAFRFEPKSTEWKTGGFSLSVGNLEIVEGLAVPLDRRGWFLTVAHCVEREPVSLVFATESRAWSAHATVVWRDEQTDLALLRADLGPDVPLSRWSPDPTPGELVFAGAQHSPSAGHVRGVERANDDARWVWHDAPVADGDSGGAILDTHGRLVAIHSATGFDVWSLSRIRRAVRPDLAKLAERIRASQE